VKRIVLSVFIGLMGLGFVAQDADARRLGGGMSQGMKRQAPPPRQQPDTPPQQATPQQPAATPATAGAAAAAPAAAARRSWLGPVAGLAAGLGIAALMSHLGMGDTLANIVTLALLVLVAVFLVRFLMRRFMPQTRGSKMQYAGAGAGAGAHAVNLDASPARDTVLSRPMGGSTALQPQPLATGGSTGRAMLPPGFDQAEFERAAKMIFIRLQAANDAGDLDDLRQFSTPEMFAAFRLDLQDRQAGKQRTDVVRLDADMADWAEEDGKQIVSVRFSGLIREEEGGGAEPFDEVWHLVRPADGSKPWAIAGIQQVEMAQKH
jgi:predicted lipid-binding transport protein (Tim44 family)